MERNGMATGPKKGPALTSLAIAAVFGLGTLFLQAGGELQRLNGALRHPASAIPSRTEAAAASSAETIEARTARWDAFEAQEGRKVPAFLTRYEALDRKVLKSNDEMHELHRLLGSPAEIRAARDYLSDIEADVSLRQTVKRIEIVDFLIEAERWDGNPNRATVVEAMRDLILKHAATASALAERSKKALVGDKIELYNALRAADPAIAEEIKRNAEGTSLEPLLDYAEQSAPTNGLRTPSTAPGSLPRGAG